MNKGIIILIFILCCSIKMNSQVVLEAVGSNTTYELITSVLAPGKDTTAVEDPQCIHPGRHIAEVWDSTLNQYVFEFYIHVTPDNDRCLYFDRQRVEIKTYDASPEHLKGTFGETVTYKWKFKLPVGFKPSSSFTHIHQIKPVGGDDGNPIFTLTPRKGTPNKLELIHDNITKVSIVNLSLFEGVWVECTEVIYIDSLRGRYSMVIKRVSDGATLLSYSNNQIKTIRSSNNFIRPKWGLYRSLNVPSDLRDEAMRFAGFSIAEGTTITTAGSGNWSSTTPNSPWQWGTLPSNSDTVILAAGHSVILDQNASVSLLIVSSNATLSTTLIDNNRSLFGNIIVNGTFNVSGGYQLNTNGNIVCTGPGASLRFASNGGKLNSQTPKLFTLSNGATLGTAINSTSGDVVQLTLTNLTLQVNNSPALTTIEYKNSGNSWVNILPNNQQYGNLVFTTASTTAGRTITLRDNINLLGSLSWSPTSTSAGSNLWDFGAYTISTSGTSATVSVNQVSSSNQIQIRGTGNNLFAGFSSYNFVSPTNSNCIVNYSATTGIQNVVPAAYNNLSISGGSEKLLSGNASADTLTLAGGLLNIGNHNLTLTSNSIVKGTPSSGNMVVAVGNGELRRQIPNSLPFSFIFPVGDNIGQADYSPVTISFASGTFSSAYVGVKLKNQKHPLNGSRSDYINRYWSISSHGISSFACDVEFVYVDSDVVGTETNLALGRFSSHWEVVGIVDPVSNKLLASGLTELSDFTGGEASALPIQLVSFVGYYIGDSVKLEWQTISEIKNFGFNVQRFNQITNGYETIGFVPGNGTTNEPKTYIFIDAQPATKYRLEQIDSNGLTSYFGPIEININSVVNTFVKKEFKLYPNYPNPFNPSTDISFSFDKSEYATLKVYNLLGEEIVTLFAGYTEPGKLYSVKFDTKSYIRNLPSGIYLSKLVSGDRIEVRKMILMK